MGALSIRSAVFGGLISFAASGFALAQDPHRPAVGGIGSPTDAMIFYVARGAAGACGPGCSEWIAAEGTVQWDTHKRLIAILDRQAGRKLPVIIHSWGRSNLSVSRPALAGSCAIAASTPMRVRPRSQPAPENPRRNASRSSATAGRSMRSSTWLTSPATLPAC
jgi:hypothetical protein